MDRLPLFKVMTVGTGVSKINEKVGLKNSAFQSCILLNKTVVLVNCFSVYLQREYYMTMYCEPFFKPLIAQSFPTLYSERFTRNSCCSVYKQCIMHKKLDGWKSDMCSLVVAR